MLLRTAVERAKPLLDRFGVLAAPIRDLAEARRTITVDRPPQEVGEFLRDGDRSPVVFARSAVLEDHQEDRPVRWRLDGGWASADLRPGPAGASELVLVVGLDRLTDGGRPRYAQNAGVVALRALHRIKSLIETGEAPTLAANPAGRAEPDPYGD
jgi:hypothetical protein